MSKQVWKYQITLSAGDQRLMIPAGAKLVCVKKQGKDICLWFEVDINKKNELLRTFRVFGTGDYIQGGNHVGTVIFTPHVWHIYETTKGVVK